MYPKVEIEFLWFQAPSIRPGCSMVGCCNTSQLVCTAGLLEGQGRPREPHVRVLRGLERGRRDWQTSSTLATLPLCSGLVLLYLLTFRPPVESLPLMPSGLHCSELLLPRSHSHITSIPEPGRGESHALGLRYEVRTDCDLLSWGAWRWPSHSWEQALCNGWIAMASEGVLDTSLGWYSVANSEAMRPEPSSMYLNPLIG